MTKRQRLMKRAFDLAIGVPLAVASIPVIAVLALASAISFRANPFFVQPRVGRDGEIFTFVKIRSLPPTAPDAADKYEINGVKNTRVGRFLRHYHLDEIPQVWLVLQGTMSLVGPRPEMVDLSSTFDPDFVTTRTRVLPGCTGLWQVSTAADGLINERPQFDQHYVENQTLRLDIWIMARTVSAVVGGSEIKDVGQVPTWTGAALSEAATALAK